MLHKKSLGFIIHFLRAYPARTALMVVLLVLAGIAEGVSILTLIPLIEVASHPGAQPEGQIAQVLFHAFGALNIAPTLSALLAFIVVTMAAKGGLLWLAINQVGYMVAQVATDLRLELIRALMVVHPLVAWQHLASAVTDDEVLERIAFRNAEALFDSAGYSPVGLETSC